MFVNLWASCERDPFKAGHPIDEIAAWMGHSPEMAIKHYNRVVKQQKAQASGSALRAMNTLNGAKRNAKVTGCYGVTAGNGDDPKKT